MRYVIMGQKVKGKNLPPKLRAKIVLGKVRKKGWVAQVALIAAVVDLTLRALL